MQLSPRSWYAVSIGCLGAAVFFWWLGNKQSNQPSPLQAPSNGPTAQVVGTNAEVRTTAGQPRPTVTGQAPPSNIAASTGAASSPSPAQPAVPVEDRLYPHRLRNTAKSLDELVRRDAAILLRNALLDTASPAPLPIPASLRGTGDPGAYVIQARGMLTDRFRDYLQAAGAQIVAYVPNNAYLVRVSAAGAQKLAGLSLTQAVLPWEPYFKLDARLLARAAEARPLPDNTLLNVLLFPDVTEPNLNHEIVSTERSPFGTVVTVRARADSLMRLAQLPQVQNIEERRTRVPANDLSRVRTRVAANSLASSNYLNLTGSGVLVNVNDSGVDATHPDLAGRVWADVPGTLNDATGHGTHVVGTILSSGQSGPAGNLASGSVAGASFRGVAPQAQAFVMPYGGLRSDTYLQETAARTNAFISNNSWGYPDAYDYSLASASFDAAVRDALPDRPFMQPALYVFAGGNNGMGDTDGGSGLPGSITAPATAKNVITVGAIEQRRNITNQTIIFGETNITVIDGQTNVTVTPSVTNRYFLPRTDSNIQVADFSARGNVGVGQEGSYGRFKPDVVAPGVMVVSTRAGAATITHTNLPGNAGQVLDSLDAAIGPYYRYESGTSMAAANVSGVLALMQEFFEQKLGRTNSPALMKALLINGARNLDEGTYDFSPENYINGQGWGVINLTNSVSAVMNSSLESAWPIILIDQSPTNALATGQTHTRQLTVSSNAARFPLRFTLVWTDPPGNPATGIKLVNDLDLVVTVSGTLGLETVTNYYVGNRFQSGASYTDPFTLTSGTTNATEIDAVRDRINNVENIFIETPVAGTYQVSVVARRVHVNAVDAHPDGIVQDYALVISSGNPGLSAPFTLSETPVATDLTPKVVTLTNGMPYLNQRVGANSPLLVSTNGATNQWNFYVFSNTGNTNTNVAFVTFLPPNLSRARTNAADLDLYVSTNPALTNLDPVVFADPNLLKSVRRGGTESIVLPNTAADQTFYIGVKSEDQQAANFGIFAYAGSEPFDQRDQNGNLVLRGIPMPIDIPDGTPDEPEGAIIFAFATEPVTIQNVVVTNTLTHEYGGDLLGNLGHEGQNAVLNNHRGFSDTVTFIWDDSDSGDILESEPSDGPATLRNFVGEEGIGLWSLTMIDSSLFHTGRVDDLIISLEPRPPELTNASGPGYTTTILPNRWFYTVVDVPVDATNLTVCGTPVFGTVELYIQQGSFPNQSNYTAFAIIGSNTTFSLPCVSLSKFDSPPLNPGRYYIGIYNPNQFPVTVKDILITIDLDLRPTFDVVYRSGGRVPILDDAVTNSVIRVTNAQLIADLKVGVRINHPRASDLVLHLVSPQGTRILLAENRGQLNTEGYGAGTLSTNVLPVASNGDWHPQTNIIVTTQTVGVVSIDYEYYGIPDRMTVYYDGALIYDTGVISGQGSFEVSFGPGLANEVVVVMNEGGNPNQGTAWNYTATVLDGRYIYTLFTDDTRLTATPIKFGQAPFTNSWSMTNLNVPNLITDFEGVAAKAYSAGEFFDGWTVEANNVEVVVDPTLSHSGSQLLVLSSGNISRNLPTQPGAEYVLRFAYHDPGIVAWWKGEGNALDTFGTNSGSSLGGMTYTSGLVGQAFNFDGVDDAVIVPASSSLNVKSFTIEGWIYPADTSMPRPIVEYAPPTGWVGVHLWHSERPSGFGGNSPGSLYSNIRPFPVTANNPFGTTSNLVSTFNWSHVALTFHQASAEAFLYHNGNRYATNVVSVSNPYTLLPVNLGYRPQGTSDSFGGRRFWGIMDEVSIYNRALTRTEIEAIHAAQAAGKSPLGGLKPNARVHVGARTLTITAKPLWEIGTIRFTAVESNTAVSLAGNPLSVLFDKIELIPVRSPTYYLPEEPLKPLIGQSAYGDWALEIWDNRVGANVTGSFAQLLNWMIHFSFANSNPPAITLTNGQCYTSTLVSNQTAYFAVNVPYAASIATNFLTASGNVDLFFNANGLPTGNYSPDTGAFMGGSASDYLLLNDTTSAGVLVSTLGSFQIDTNGQIVSGNPLPALQPGGTYYLAVQNAAPGESNTFTICLNFDAVDPSQLNVTPLTPNVGTNNCIGVTNLIAYYQVYVPPEAYGVTFLLTNLSGNVDLVVHQGLPLPNPNFYDFHSVNSGTTPEVIALDDFTFSQLWGTWYVGVYNLSTNPVCYDIVAITGLGVPPTTLTNGVPLTTTLSTNEIDYFSFTVPTNAYLAVIQITNANGNVDMYVGNNPPVTPDPGNYVVASTNGAATNEMVILTTNAAPPAIQIESGVWYVYVTNLEATSVTYTIVVNLFTNLPFPVVTLTNGIDYAVTNATNAVDYYHVVVSSNAIQANFEVLNPSGNVDLFLSYGLPVPSPSNYWFLSTNLGTGNEFIAVTTNLATHALVPGDWYLAVVHADTNALSYTVRFTEFIVGTNVFVMTNDVPYTNNLASTNGPIAEGIDYYVYNLTNTNVTWLTIDVTDLTADVNLVVSYELPLPTLASNHYSSLNLGTNPEQVMIITNVVATNSLPPPLQSGNWFIGVPHFGLSDSNLSYVLTVHEYTNAPPVITALTNGVAETNLILAAGEAAYYQFMVSSNAVQANFEVLRPSGNVDLFLKPGLPLPSEGLFAYASTNLGTAPEFIPVATNSAPTALRPGLWFLTLVNRESTNVSYQVRVTEFVLGNPFLVPLTNQVPHTNSLVSTNGPVPDGIDYYAFDVSTNASWISVDVLNPSVDVTLLVQYGVPLPTVLNSHYFSVNPGTNDEQVFVFTNSLPVPLQPGRWYLGVAHQGVAATNLSYVIVAREYTNTPPVFQSVPDCAWVPPLSQISNLFAYAYLVDIASNAVQADFVLGDYSDTNLVANLAMFIRPVLSLPGPLNYAYAVTNAGNQSQTLVVATNTLPVPLTSGPWIAAVENFDTNVADFCFDVIQYIPGTPSLVILTNAEPYTNSIVITNGTVADGIDYYLFTVTNDAVWAVFEILDPSAEVDLLIKRVLPLPTLSSYDYSSLNGGTLNEHVLVTTNSPVPLTRGAWFLGVTRQGLSVSNLTYTIRATASTNPLPTFTVLTNAVSTSNTLAVAGIDYYLFLASTQAVQANFQVLNASGNVDLFLKPGLALPGPLNHTYASTNSGTNGEFIAVATNSLPLPLSPGVWSLAVVNADTNPASYLVRAVEFVPGTPQLVELTEGLAVTNRVALTNEHFLDRVEYYFFNVSTSATWVTFDVLGMNTNVDLVVSRVPLLPTATNFDYGSFNQFLNDEQVMITSNAAPVSLQTGTWFVGVLWPAATNDVTYTIVATEHTNLPPAIMTLTNAMPYANNLTAGSTQFYRFTVSGPALEAHFELLALSGNVDLFVKQGLPLAFTTKAVYASAQVGSSNEFISVSRNPALPVPLASGDWYLAVVNREAVPVSNVVRVTEYVPGTLQLPVLDNAVALPGTLPGQNDALNRSVAYYEFRNFTNALQVNFEVQNSTGNVDLFASPNDWLPEVEPRGNTNAWAGRYSTNSAVNDEAIVVLAGSGVELSPWRLAVVNQDAANVDYTIRATEYVLDSPQLVRLTNGVNFAKTLTPTNGLVEDGIDYYYFEVTNGVVWVAFDVIQPSANVQLVVRSNIPLPTLTGYDYLSANPGTNDEQIWVSTNSPVALTPGHWYLGVVREGLAVSSLSYTVRATAYTQLPPAVTELPNATDVVGVGLPGSTQYFRFSAWTNALQANFELFDLSGAVDLFLKPGLPLPSANLFAYAGTNTGTNAEFVGVATNTAPTPLMPGDWYLAVVNNDVNPVSYRVRVTQYAIGSNVVQLADTTPYSTNLLAPAGAGIDYYAFEVTTNHSWVAFDVLNPSADVELLVSRELPLPRPYVYDCRSANAGTNAEQVLLGTNSSPVALTAGLWFLGVVRTEAISSDLSYVVQASAFSNAAPLITVLTSGVSYTSSIAAGSVTQYFKLMVPTNAVQADFEILTASGNVDLFVRQWLPLDNFVYASLNSGTNRETINVATNTPPVPLSAGDWYLAVVNRETTNVDYVVRAIAWPPLVRLTNGVAYTSTTTVGNGFVLDDLDYYVFTVPAGSAWAKFQILNPSANVDLRVSRGVPLPSLAQSDYRSVNPFTNHEQVLVITNSAPVPLSPGEWYLGISHFGLNVTSLVYTVVAETFTNTPPAFIMLTNALAYADSVNAAQAAAYYQIEISAGAVQAHFEVLRPSDDVSLFIQPGQALVDPSTFAYASTNSGTNQEFIRVATNGAPAPLSPGIWSLLVFSPATNQANYEVRVTEFVPGTTQLPWLSNGVAFSNLIAATNELINGIDYYIFDAPTGGVWATFEVLKPAAGVELMLSRQVPLPTTTNFDYRSDNLGTNDEGILVQTNSPVPLAPGPWYLGVAHAVSATNTNDLVYTIVATVFTSAPPAITVISNGLAFTNTPALSTNAVDYFQFTVSTNAVRAQFEILHPDSDVTLIAHQGLPLPTLVNYHYLSANNGTNHELIVVFNNSSPIPLSPGDWYLAVLKLMTNEVNYEVKFTEFAEYGTNLYITDISVSTNDICLVWTNAVPGVNYHIQGRPSLTSPVWYAASPTLVATNTTMSYCLPLPTPFQFFRVAEGLGPLTLTPSVTFTDMTSTPHGFVLTWQSDPAMKFVVEWAPTLTGPWAPSAGVVDSTNGTFAYTDATASKGASSAVRFYRVKLVP